MKRLLTIGLVVILSLGIATTVFASPNRGAQSGCICSIENRNHLFWDAAGNFLSRAEVEANLNAAVGAGTITAAQRDLLLERFDFCAAFGCGASGARRCGAGRGFGHGAGHGAGHGGGRGLHCRR